MEKKVRGEEKPVLLIIASGCFGLQVSCLIAALLFKYVPSQLWIGAFAAIFLIVGLIITISAQNVNGDKTSKG